MDTSTESARPRFTLFPELQHAGEGPFQVQHIQPDFSPPHRLFEPHPAKFEDLEAATSACKRAADQLLLASLQPGMSGAALWQAYKDFGKGFCVVDRVGLLEFSASPYAHRRCAELAPGPYAPAPRENLTTAQQQARDHDQVLAEDNERRAAGARQALALALWLHGCVPLIWFTVKASELHTTAGEVIYGALMLAGFGYFVALFWLKAQVDRWFGPRR